MTSVPVSYAHRASGRLGGGNHIAFIKYKKELKDIHKITELRDDRCIEQTITHVS